MSDEFADDAVNISDEALGIDSERHQHATPRQAFLLIAVALALALAALIFYLLFLLSPGSLVERGGEPRARLQPILVIRGPGRGDTPVFSRPLGAALGPSGNIYVSDTENNRICVFNSRGVFQSEFGGRGVAKPAPGVEATWDEGELNYPLGLDVSEDGELYVADFRNDSISVFAEDGEFLRRFPDPYQVVGRGASGQDGTGISVTDVAVRDGLVYATDEFQIVVFTTEGEFVRQFGMPGLQEGGLDRPNGIEVDEDGIIYVSDSNHNRVAAYSPEGEVLWTLGTTITTVSGEADYVFGLPRGIALTGDDTLLVVDAFEFELVEVGLDGELLDRYGERGVEPAQMNFPNGIDVSGDLIVVADKENDRVQLLEIVR